MRHRSMQEEGRKGDGEGSGSPETRKTGERSAWGRLGVVGHSHSLQVHKGVLSIGGLGFFLNDH